VTPPPRLSIIIPVVQEARNLEERLPSLVASYPDAEVVVVDAGSDDDTREVVSRFPSVTLIESSRGRARQMNAGAAAAGGEILLFLHADTQLPNGADRAIAEVLRTPSVVGGRFDARIDNPRFPFRMIAALMNLRSRLTRISTGDQAIFVRRLTFQSLGGYPEIPLMEDIELTRRLKGVGRLIALRLSVTTSARKWEREGVVRTILLMWTLRLLYVCGVAPERLHRWYYGPSREPGGSAGERGAEPARTERG
jgi:rSAM/selenodomain-associated transferase 2